MSRSAKKDDVMVAVMGTTGTGKSSFIRHLTKDPKIYVGESIESKTSEIQTSCYTDARTGHPVTLIDTPGFDDSRLGEGITDTDILQKIIDFLDPKEGQGKKLNGIIYLHRISDPRMGGLAKKNFRIFEQLCGQKSLHNVRIVTTFWDCDGGKGPMREAELMAGPTMKPLLDSGAQMCRHTDTVESAQKIMAELIPLQEVTTLIQEEVAKEMPLGKTSAGRVINEEIEKLEKKHKEDLDEVQRELEQSAQVNDEKLRAESETRRRVLEEKLMRVEEDRNRLEMTVPQVRERRKKAKDVIKEVQAEIEVKTAQLAEAWKTGDDVKVKDVEKELAELSRLRQEAERFSKLGIFGRLLHNWAEHTGDHSTQLKKEKNLFGKFTDNVRSVFRRK